MKMEFGQALLFVVLVDTIGTNGFETSKVFMVYC